MSAPSQETQRVSERLIRGQEVAKVIERQTAVGATALRDAGVEPLLAVLYLGDHGDAASYRRVIKRQAARVGIAVREVALAEVPDAAAFQAALDALNDDVAVHGILVQTPLTLEQRQAATYSLSPHKDAEGITAVNLGRLLLREPEVLPCTAASVLALIESRVPILHGKRVVIVNASPTIGRPLSQILMGKRATVTVCASKTVDLPAETRRAEILVVAVGKPRFMGPEYIGEGAIVIDVGINPSPDGTSIVGDVDTEAVLDRVAGITPVPGGVGPVTTALLLANVIQLARIQRGLAPSPIDS